MDRLKWGIVAAALTCLLGTSTAWANPNTSGKVVCTGTNTGVQNVVVYFQRDAWYGADVTDSNGDFALWVPYLTGAYNVYLNLGAGPVLWGAVDIANAPFTIEVNVPGCAPPPPECPALEGLTERTFCGGLGSPKSECEAFGLSALFKDDNVDAASFTATRNADVALVKAADCYNLYLDVTVGEVLYPPYRHNISHVTYCSCPE